MRFRYLYCLPIPEAASTGMHAGRAGARMGDQKGS